MTTRLIQIRKPTEAWSRGLVRTHSLPEAQAIARDLAQEIRRRVALGACDGSATATHRQQVAKAYGHPAAADVVEVSWEICKGDLTRLVARVDRGQATDMAPVAYLPRLLPVGSCTDGHLLARIARAHVLLAARRELARLASRAARADSAATIPASA